jgi:hypothetical protein
VHRMALVMLAALLPVAVAKEKIRDKVTPLPASVATTLNGKVLAVTRHERPYFNATTDMEGFTALLPYHVDFDGNKLIDEFGIADPAYILEQHLAPAIATYHSMQLRPGPAAVIDKDVADLLASKFGDADFVLDVRSMGWGFTYVPPRLNRYGIGYGAFVELFDVKSGKRVARLSCHTHTWDHPAAPTEKELLANRARLLKDTSDSLAWRCMNRSAAQAFGIPPEWLPRMPAELANPFARTNRARNNYE